MWQKRAEEVYFKVLEGLAITFIHANRAELELGVTASAFCSVHRGTSIFHAIRTRLQNISTVQQEASYARFVFHF
jgi:hypothetical protein